MNTAPEFSVIIPTYNSALSIGRAVESLLTQTYPANEIIVVDDGSQDNTQEVVKHFGNAVHYVYQDNRGVSAARNHGAEIARCHWLAFLDADDWYYPERLAIHAEMILKYKDLDFITGNFDYIDDQGRILQESMKSTPAGLCLLKKAGKRNFILMDCEDICGFVEQQFGDVRTLSVPREIFLNLGGFPESFTICEDVYFLIRLCAVSRRIGVVCRPLAAYFIHHNGLIRSDMIRAQRQSVLALLDLKGQISKRDEAFVYRGLLGALRRARMDFAYTLLRSNERGRALRTVFPLLFERPGIQAFRDIFSICLGFKERR